MLLADVDDVGSQEQEKELDSLLGSWSPRYLDSLLVERVEALDKLIRYQDARSPFGAAVQLLMLQSASAIGQLLMSELDDLSPSARRVIMRVEGEINQMAHSAYQVLAASIDDPDLATLESVFMNDPEDGPHQIAALEKVLASV